MDGNNFQLIAMIVTSSMNSNAPQNLNLKSPFFWMDFGARKKNTSEKTFFRRSLFVWYIFGPGLSYISSQFRWVSSQASLQRSCWEF